MQGVGTRNLYIPHFFSWVIIAGISFGLFSSGNIVVSAATGNNGYAHIGGDAAKTSSKGRYRFVNNAFVHRSGTYTYGFKLTNGIDSVEYSNDYFENVTTAAWADATGSAK